MPDVTDTSELGTKRGAGSRLSLLLSAPQMLTEGFPMPPPDGVNYSGYDGYRFSMKHYEPVSEKSPMYV